MKLVVGLGNPEKKYEFTRHNCGFRAIDYYASKNNLSFKSKFNGHYAETIVNNTKLILLKPQTYMNLSGKSIVQVVNFYKIPIENVFVIYDDIDIEPGEIKIRKKGSSGSHNGMKSVVAELQTEDFARIRVGIGKPEYKDDMINYVIGAIPEEERNILDEGTTKAEKAMISIIKDGIDIAMNKFN